MHRTYTAPTLLDAKTTKTAALQRPKVSLKRLPPTVERIALAALITIATAGCSLLKQAPALDPIQFNYATAHTEAAATGLVRVFNLKGDTVLQFIDISAAQPKVYDGEDTTPLPYQVIGQYAVVAGERNAMRVVAKGGTAVVTRSTPIPTAAAAAELAKLDASGAQLPAEASVADQLTQMRKELAEARQALAQLQRPNIRPTALIVPVLDGSKTWTLQANKTLKDNIARLAREAGYAEPRWKASNPYMVTYTVKYTGTFTDVIGQIAGEVVALDFRVYSWKRTLEVVDATE